MCEKDTPVLGYQSVFGRAGLVADDISFHLLSKHNQVMTNRFMHADNDRHETTRACIGKTSNKIRKEKT